jgi:VIT1/CCC1 family predicted Fe2+/Mn2+ transporter
MKVRESLTDNGESGTVLTIPEGISRYPHNWIYGIFNLVSFILGVIFLLYVFAAIEERW